MPDPQQAGLALKKICLHLTGSVGKEGRDDGAHSFDHARLTMPDLYAWGEIRITQQLAGGFAPPPPAGRIG